ncbi:hypothetical protein ACT3SP_00765 [Brachybacterium sp. AOP43-C2-M15]|uniref:hypothetical protein n=1 Tax=Brachybacterium sp. AOP43-C2-M15 TaxID=3457661 RepID=UPI004034BAA9
MDDRSGGQAPQLPDFSGRAADPDGTQGIGGYGTAGGAGDGHGGRPPRDRDHGDPGRGGRGPLLAVVLGTAGCLAVVLAIVALVLSQTVFRGAPEDPTGQEPSAVEEDPERTRPSEYVPSEEQTDEAGDGEITLAEQPTVECTTHDDVGESEQAQGVVRGGGLEFTPADGWDVGGDWSGSSAYTVDQGFAHQPVENGWYSVIGVGAVDFPEDEGGYPGAQETARAIFQCSLSRDDAQEIYGDPVELMEYREEATTVDGHPARVVGADAQLDETALFHTTDAWRLVVIVVDAPEGPAVFHGGAALGHDQQVADLEAMIESLQVA